MNNSILKATIYDFADILELQKIAFYPIALLIKCYRDSTNDSNRVKNILKNISVRRMTKRI